MKHTLNLVLRLMVICVVAALCLGATFSVTDPIIERLAEEERAAAYRTLLPDAVEFDDIEYSAHDEFAKITGVIAGISPSGLSGWCVSIKSMGYKSDIPLIIGVRADGTFSGLRVGSNDETVGLGSKISEPAFYEQFTGVHPPLALKTDIQAISGATISSRAVLSAVNTVYSFYQAQLQ